MTVQPPAVGAQPAAPAAPVTPVAPAPHVPDLWLHYHGFSLFSWIAGVSLACLVIAFLMHRYGVAQGGGKAYLASEPVHNLPVVHTLYDWAEARAFDLYEWFIGKTLRGASLAVYAVVDRGIDAVYEHLVTWIGGLSIRGLRWAHNGVYANYLAWMVGGFVVLAWFIIAVVR